MLNLGILSQNMACRGGFTPGTLAPSAWYDPSDLSTLFQDTAGTTPVTAAGQPVALMRDKSGNGLHLSQATGTKCPLWQADGSLLFDGVDDYLSSASSVSGNSQSIVVAGIGTAASTVSIFNMAVGASDRISVNIAGSTVSDSARYFNGSVTTGRQIAPIATASVITAEIDKVTPTVSLRLNAGNSTGANTNATGSTVGTFLGARDAAAAFYAGKFYGLVQLARTITSTERANLETYLGAKAGIVL